MQSPISDMEAYHRRLEGSHDFRIFVDVLDLNENPVGSAIFVDGQKNLQGASDALVRTTATLTLADPDGALDFSDASSWSGTSVWPDRLIRVRHQITVSGFGAVECVAFIGVPDSISRNGGEVQVSCQDKAALATDGQASLVLPKGMNVGAAVRKIMAERTGEFRFNLPATTRTLSKPYNVGLTEDIAPFAIAKQITESEWGGLQLIYTTDGILTARQKPTRPVAEMRVLLDVAQSSTDFKAAYNYVEIRGKGKALGKASWPADHPLSSTRLARQGVARLKPMIEENDAFTTNAQAQGVAQTDLERSFAVDGSLSLIPFRHLDVDDVVTVNTTAGTFDVALDGDCSIPFGVGGPMTIGTHRWVSRPVEVHEAA